MKKCALIRYSLGFFCLALALSGGDVLLGQPLVYHFDAADYTLEINLWQENDEYPLWDVQDLIEDKQGFIWLVGKSGLARFNGEHFQVYAGKAAGLRYPGYAKLASDVNGKLWLFSTRGLETKIDVFDPATGTAIPVQAYLGEDLTFSELFYYGLFRIDDAIWILDPAGHGGRFDGKWTWILQDTVNQAADVARYYYPRRDGLFWMIENMDKPSPHPGKWQIKVVNGTGTPLRDYEFRKAYGSSVWLASDYSLWYYAAGERQVVERFGQTDSLFNLQEDRLEAFSFRTYPNHLFTGGLQFPDYLNLLFCANGLSIYRGNKVNVLFKDGKVVMRDFKQLLFEQFKIETKIRLYASSDALWLGSSNGLFRIQVNPKKIITYPYAAGKSVSFRGITSRNDSTILAVSYSGAFSLATKAKQFTTITYPHNTVSRVIQRVDNQLWITSHRNEVVRYNLVTGKYDIFSTPGLSENFEGNALHWLPDSTLLLGGLRGVWSLARGAQALTQHSLPDKAVYCWFQNNDELWAGTNAGLVRYNQNGKVLDHYPLLGPGSAPLKVFFIHQDQDQLFWLATDQGLVRWQPLANEIRRYTLADGLANETLHAVYEDRQRRQRGVGLANLAPADQ
ncbi:MAG: hypothetical protein DA408_21510, partial [Bacteroidetes bacterium]